MVKERISATIEKSTSRKLSEFLKQSRRYRNKSHFIEEIIEEAIEKLNGVKNAEK